MKMVEMWGTGKQKNKSQFPQDEEEEGEGPTSLCPPPLEVVVNKDTGERQGVKDEGREKKRKKRRYKNKKHWERSVGRPRHKSQTAAKKGEDKTVPPVRTHAPGEESTRQAQVANQKNVSGVTSKKKRRRRRVS